MDGFVFIVFDFFFCSWKLTISAIRSFHVAPYGAVDSTLLQPMHKFPRNRISFVKPGLFWHKGNFLHFHQLWFVYRLLLVKSVSWWIQIINCFLYVFYNIKNHYKNCTFLQLQQHTVQAWVILAFININIKQSKTK